MYALAKLVTILRIVTVLVLHVLQRFCVISVTYVHNKVAIHPVLKCSKIRRMVAVLDCSV